jgi:hypothetical protein
LRAWRWRPAVIEASLDSGDGDEVVYMDNGFREVMEELPDGVFTIDHRRRHVGLPGIWRMRLGES